jgi:hypothetical protein
MLLENFLKIKIKKNLYSLSKIINLQKPKYFSDWDGSFNGHALPAGTYYYIIRISGLTEPFKGPLTIIRE